MSEPHSRTRWSSKGRSIRGGGGLSSLLSCRAEKDAKQASSNGRVSLFRIYGCRLPSHSSTCRSAFVEPCNKSSTGRKEWRKGGRRSLSDSLVIPQGFYLPSDSPQIIRTISESAILHQHNMQHITDPPLKSCFGSEGDITYQKHMEPLVQDASCIKHSSELKLMNGFVDSTNPNYEIVGGGMEVAPSGCLNSTSEKFSETQNHLSKMDLGRLKLSEPEQHWNVGSTTSSGAAELDEGKSYGEIMTRLSEDQQQSLVRIIAKAAAVTSPMLQTNKENGGTEEELSSSEQFVNTNSDTKSAEQFHGNRAQETDVQYDDNSDNTECSARVCLDGSMNMHDEEDDHMDTKKVGELWCLGDFGSCQVKRFPPPISVLANETHPGLPTHMQRTFWRSMKRDGRFVLQEVQAQPQEFFHATRENGRMRLQLIRSDSNEVEEAVDEAEKTLDEAEAARNEAEEVLDEPEEAIPSHTDEANGDEQRTNQNVSSCEENLLEMMDNSNNYQGYQKMQIHGTTGTSSEQVVKPVRDSSDYIKGSEVTPENMTESSEGTLENITKRDELRQEYPQSHFSSSSGFDTTMHVLSPKPGQPFLKLPYPTVLQMVLWL